MRKVGWSKTFMRDLRRARRRSKNLEKLKQVSQKLADNIPLPQRHRNHKLTGNYDGRWECHIEPDWLLIYRLTDPSLTLERTGSHSDLFK